MKLVVGLGNPGPEYVFSRHNVGWWVLDRLLERLGADEGRSCFQGQMYSALYRGEKVLLLKPLTYMNLSGQSLGEVLRYYKLTPEDLLLCYDDIDLPPGRLRYRTQGSAGGHNGVKSVIAHLGSQTFARIKVGVGAKPVGADLARHVLATPAPAERELIDCAVEAAAQYACMWLQGADDRSLTAKVNSFRALTDGPA